MNIEKIQPSVAFTIVGCLSPLFLNFLAFFLLSPDLFHSLNLWQFIGVGIGISMPIILLSGYSVSCIPADNKTNAKMEHFGLGGIFSCGMLTIALLISYWCMLSLKTYYLIVFLLEVLFFIIALITNWQENSPKSN